MSLIINVKVEVLLQLRLYFFRHNIIENNIFNTIKLANPFEWDWYIIFLNKIILQLLETFNRLLVGYANNFISFHFCIFSKNAINDFLVSVLSSYSIDNILSSIDKKSLAETLLSFPNNLSMECCIWQLSRWEFSSSSDKIISVSSSDDGRIPVLIQQFFIVFTVTLSQAVAVIWITSSIESFEGDTPVSISLSNYWMRFSQSSCLYLAWKVRWQINKLKF